MRPPHRIHRCARAASWLLALVVGCNYDWEPDDPGDFDGDGGLGDSSMEPAIAGEAGVAADGAPAGEASSTPDATWMDAEQSQPVGDAANNLPARDASSSQSTSEASSSEPASDATSSEPSDGSSSQPLDAASNQPLDASSGANRDATAPDAGTSCASGQHTCSSRCVANNSLQSCGQSCSPCVPPANGVSSCDGTQCGFTCMSSYHACGTTCASNSDVATCGTRCAPCPAVANGRAVCNQGTCGATCNADALNCGATCGLKSYGFEDGTLSGAAREDLNSTGATTQVLSSRTRAHTGSRALSIGFSVPDSTPRNLSVHLPTCASGPGAVLSGSQVSFWVYLDGPATLGGNLAISLRTNSSSGFVERAYDLSVATNTWLNLRGPVQSDWGAINAIGVYMYAYPQGGSSWTGTVYIDDVTIE